MNRSNPIQNGFALSIGTIISTAGYLSSPSNLNRKQNPLNEISLNPLMLSQAIVISSDQSPEMSVHDQIGDKNTKKNPELAFATQARCIDMESQSITE